MTEERHESQPSLSGDPLVASSLLCHDHSAPFQPPPFPKVDRSIRYERLLQVIDKVMAHAQSEFDCQQAVQELCGNDAEMKNGADDYDDDDDDDDRGEAQSAKPAAGPVLVPAPTNDSNDDRNRQGYEDDNQHTDHETSMDMSVATTTNSMMAVDSTSHIALQQLLQSMLEQMQEMAVPQIHMYLHKHNVPQQLLALETAVAAVHWVDMVQQQADQASAKVAAQQATTVLMHHHSTNGNVDPHDWVQQQTYHGLLEQRNRLESELQTIQATVTELQETYTQRVALLDQRYQQQLQPLARALEASSTGRPT